MKIQYSDDLKTLIKEYENEDNLENVSIIDNDYNCICLLYRLLVDNRFIKYKDIILDIKKPEK